MDETLLAAVERLHGLGATEVDYSVSPAGVNHLRVRFEPQAPRLEFPADEPMTEDERQAAFEKLAYHSA